MSKMDRHFKRTIVIATLSVLTMSVLPACEKGLMLRDPKITAPDFEVKVQAPEEKSGTPATVQIELNSVTVSDTTGESTDPKDKQFTGLIEFKLGLKDKPETARLIQVEAVVKVFNQFNTSGKIENQAGEPRMMYKARCGDELCNKFYISVNFDFQDESGLSRDQKNMVIAAYLDKKIVKRHLLDFDLSTVTLASQIKALEAMDLESVKMPQAGDKVDPTLKNAPAENGDTAGTGFKTPDTGKELKVDEPQVKAGVTAPSGVEEKSLETVPSEEAPAADSTSPAL